MDMTDFKEFCTNCNAELKSATCFNCFHVNSTKHLFGTTVCPHWFMQVECSSDGKTTAKCSNCDKNASVAQLD